MATPPSGGGPGDYVAWAKLVPGVTRAWELPWAPKVGFVTLLFMRDLDNDPFPTPEQVDDVRKVLLARAPIIAPAPIVIGPDKLNITLDIALTLEPGYDLATVQAAIYANVRKMLFLRTAPKKLGWVLYRSWITEAISSTPGEFNSVLLSPGADIPVAALALPVLDDGDIDWS